ncbi:hypothetical protein C8R44DRAFT_869031 [Mycena epipterygia]|nr:hypothetical protein C8R44DRAFT_869031 [Mycena epipterygia]
MVTLPPSPSVPRPFLARVPLCPRSPAPPQPSPFDARRFRTATHRDRSLPTPSDTAPSVSPPDTAQPRRRSTRRVCLRVCGGTLRRSRRHIFDAHDEHDHSCAYSPLTGHGQYTAALHCSSLPCPAACPARPAFILVIAVALRPLLDIDTPFATDSFALLTAHAASLWVSSAHSTPFRQEKLRANRNNGQ